LDVAVELESYLEQRGKKAELEAIRKITQLIQVSYVRQGEPLGLGHAVLVAKNLVGDEPFAVILPDDVMDANPPALKQMIDVYERLQGPVLAVERVPQEDVSSYGVVAFDQSQSLGQRRCIGSPTSWKSRAGKKRRPNLAIIGRYILTPDIFPALEATVSDRTGEIPTHDGLKRLLKERPNLRVPGQRRAPRYRQQARIPEGGGVFRAPAPRSRGAVPPLPGVARTENRGEKLIFLGGRRGRRAGRARGRVALRAALFRSSVALGLSLLAAAVALACVRLPLSIPLEPLSDLPFCA
jgi:hypothetical protein